MRVIFEDSRQLFWFCVDSAVPGVAQQAARGAAAPAAKRKQASISREEGPAEGGVQKRWAGGEAALQQSEAGSGEPGGSGGVVMPATPAARPAWMAQPPFDPLTFQRRVQEEMAARGAAAAEGPPGPSLLLEKKAQAWSRHHAAAVGGAPPAAQ